MDGQANSPGRVIGFVNALATAGGPHNIEIAVG